LHSSSAILRRACASSVAPFRTMLARQHRDFRWPPRIARKRLLSMTPNYISPAMEQGSSHCKPSGQGRTALPSLHPLDTRALEISTEGSLRNLGHRSSFDSPVP